ncbi:hypothetical protein TNCV_4018731 [Trichonephila clavipes]|nr:hypothetical protein TNCV_4018731 [Trichonephila clavipes]
MKCHSGPKDSLRGLIEGTIEPHQNRWNVFGTDRVNWRNPPSPTKGYEEILLRQSRYALTANHCHDNRGVRLELIGLRRGDLVCFVIKVNSTFLPLMDFCSLEESQEVETDQAIEEPTEIMHLNQDSEMYLQVDDHVLPGKCPAAVSSEKQDLLHMEFYHHLPSWDMNEQMPYFSSVSDEWSRDLKSVRYRNSVHVEVSGYCSPKLKYCVNI